MKFHAGADFARAPRPLPPTKTPAAPEWWRVTLFLFQPPSSRRNPPRVLMSLRSAVLAAAARLLLGLPPGAPAATLAGSAATAKFYTADGTLPVSHFPMVWEWNNTAIPGWDVTPRYLKRP